MWRPTSSIKGELLAQSLGVSGGDNVALAAAARENDPTAGPNTA